MIDDPEKKQLHDALVYVTANLAIAVRLIEQNEASIRTTLPYEGMLDTMLADYHRSIGFGRRALHQHTED